MRVVYELTFVVGNTIRHFSEHETVAAARAKATELDNSFIYASWSVNDNETWQFRHTKTGRFDIDRKEKIVEPDIKYGERRWGAFA